MENKTFCVIPWVHVAISTSGSFRPCCTVSYLKDDYKPGEKTGGFESFHYIYKEKIEDVWNSNTYRDFRKKMLRGEKISACSRCYREEAAGIASPRIRNNETFDLNINELDPEGFCSLDQIKYIDIRLGNKCNIKCRMCNPYTSDQWVSDERKTHLRGTPEEELIRLESMDWYNNELFWENISALLDTCEIMYFSGGEPTLFKGRKYKLFDECIDKGLAKNITLRYNTNATLLPKELIEYWKHFKKVRVQCSIDGFGKVNEYIRYPTKWKTIDRSMKILNELRETNQNMSVYVYTAVQMYNAFDLINLLDYLKQYEIFPFLNILNHPSYYNLKTLYKDQKEIVSDKINSWYEKNRKHFNQDCDDLLNVIKYMNKDDWSHLYKDFLYEAKLLDEVRDQKLEDYIPELVRRSDET